MSRVKKNTKTQCQNVLWKSGKACLIPIFLEGRGLKIKGTAYLKYFRHNLILAIEKHYPRNSFLFVQDSAPSNHGNIMQNYLKEKSRSRFMKVIKIVNEGLKAQAENYISNKMIYLESLFSNLNFQVRWFLGTKELMRWI